MEKNYYKNYKQLIYTAHQLINRLFARDKVYRTLQLHFFICYISSKKPEKYTHTGLKNVQFCFLCVKVYKAISDSLENHKIMNCIVLSIIISCLYMYLKKNFVVQHFILIVCNNNAKKQHMQNLINDQMNIDATYFYIFCFPFHMTLTFDPMTAQ